VVPPLGDGALLPEWPITATISAPELQVWPPASVLTVVPLPVVALEA